MFYTTCCVSLLVSLCVSTHAMGSGDTPPTPHHSYVLDMVLSYLLYVLVYNILLLYVMHHYCMQSPHAVL